MDDAPGKGDDVRSRGRVFPGGRVDPGDSDPDVPWAGAGPDTFAARMGTDVEGARSLVTAAVRELFEEQELLLARPLPLHSVEKARAALENVVFRWRIS